MIDEPSIESYSCQAARLVLSVVRLVRSTPEHPVLSLPGAVSSAAQAAWEGVGQAYLRVSEQSWDGPEFLKRPRPSRAPPRSRSVGALQSQPPVPPPVVPVVKLEFKRWLRSGDGKQAFSKTADALHPLLETLFLRQIEFSGNALDCPVSR